MHTDIGGSPAGSGEQVAWAESQDTVTIPRSEWDKTKEKAGKYHEMAGKYYNLKDENQKKAAQPVDENYDDLPEDQRIEKLAERKVSQLLSQKEQEDAQKKEESAFLEANPDAYEHLDDIRELRKRNPWVSYRKLYSFFFDEEPKVVPQQRLRWSAPAQEILNEDEFSANAVNEGLKELMGR